MNQPSQFDNQTTAPQQHRRPSVWPALLAFLLIGAIYMVVPEQLPIGPSWLLLAVIIAFLIPVSITRWRGKLHITHRLGFAILAIVTACVAASAAFLLLHLTSGTVRAPTLLRDAALIWVANILMFARPPTSRRTAVSVHPNAVSTPSLAARVACYLDEVREI